MKTKLREKEKWDTTKAKLPNPKVFQQTKMHSVCYEPIPFLPYLKPPMQGNTHNVYLNTYIDYRKDNTQTYPHN